MPASAVAAGEIAGRFLVGFVQASIIVAGTRVFFGVSWGLVPAIAIVAAFALLAGSASVAVGTVARTAEQAILLGTAGAIALAVLGRALWPTELVGPVLRGVSRFVPHSSTIDGLLAAQQGVGGTPVAKAILLPLAVTAVLLPLTARRLIRAVTP